MIWGASGSYLGLWLLALSPLLFWRSETKLGGLDKQLLLQFEFHPSELARLPWVVGESFGARSSQPGFVRKLVADNSPILTATSPDWSPYEWVKEVVRRSRTRADQIGALYQTREGAFSAWLKSKEVDPAFSTAELVNEFAASSPIVSLGFGSVEYYLTLEVGTPAQETLLIIDTGSELTWVECRPCNTCLSNMTFEPTKSSSYSVVSCSDALCTNLTGAISGCDTSVQECQFHIVYGDGSATVGDVATDVVATQPAADRVTEGATDQTLVLGCGQYTRPGLELGASGLMGLDKGPLSFASQLDAKKFSYCLPDRFAQNASQGYIYFGHLPEQVNSSNGLEWERTPMVTNALLSTSFYFLGVTGLSVGGKPVDIPQSAWTVDNVTGTGGVLLDSGTTIQLLRTDVYAPLRTVLEAQTVGLELNNSAEAELGFGPCYHVADPSTLSSAVPNMTVHLQGGVNWALPIGNYLWPVSRERAVYCYAFVSSSHPFSIFGNLFQQNFVIEHDLSRSMFSISSFTDCSLQAD